jgi:hypothetical protein
MISAAVGRRAEVYMLQELIIRDRGLPDASEFDAFRLSTEAKRNVTAVGSEILTHTPNFFGACAVISAMWAALLRDRHAIPALAVAGDLTIDGSTVFRCSSNIPHPDELTQSVFSSWDGHCWIEIDGHIGDGSIFRTARAIQRPSVLKQFINVRFRPEKQLILSRCSDMESINMHYTPRFVLTEAQVNMLINGMQDLVSNGPLSS